MDAALVGTCEQRKTCWAKVIDTLHIHLVSLKECLIGKMLLLFYVYGFLTLFLSKNWSLRQLVRMIVHQHLMSQIIYSMKYSPTSYLQLHNLKERTPEVLTKSLTYLAEGWCGLFICWATSKRGPSCSTWACQGGPWLALDTRMKTGRWAVFWIMYQTCSLWIFQTWHSPWYSTIAIIYIHRGCPPKMYTRFFLKESNFF